MPMRQLGGATVPRALAWNQEDLVQTQLAGISLYPALPG